MGEDEVVNARIRNTDLGFHDGFGSIRNSWLHLEGDGWGQGFGGFALGGVYTDAWVYGILDALECRHWEELHASDGACNEHCNAEGCTCTRYYSAPEGEANG